MKAMDLFPLTLMRDGGVCTLGLIAISLYDPSMIPLTLSFGAGICLTVGLAWMAVDRWEKEAGISIEKHIYIRPECSIVVVRSPMQGMSEKAEGALFADFYPWEDGLPDKASDMIREADRRSNDAIPFLKDVPNTRNVIKFHRSIPISQREQEEAIQDYFDTMKNLEIGKIRKVNYTGQ